MQTDGHASTEYVIEEVMDFDKAWPALEALTFGIIEYHRPWDNRKLRPNWSGIMREYMETQCTTLPARRPGGEAIGFLTGTIRSDFGIFEGTFGHVDNAFVVERARKEGIGRGLYDRFEGICRARGASEVRLEVATGNKLGARFWRGAGFEVQMQEMSKSLEVTA